MTTYFTSDSHYGHANVITYCRRPFKDLAEMNAELVRRWNARVKPDDVVFHLGDVAMGPRTNIGEFVRQLNGYKILIRGNHDRSKTAMLEAGFNEAHNQHIYMAQLGDEWVDVFLRHVPLYDEEQWRSLTLRTRYHLCGHVHEEWVRRGDIVNVGVDVRGFEPKTLEELLTS